MAWRPIRKIKERISERVLAWRIKRGYKALTKSRKTNKNFPFKKK